MKHNMKKTLFLSWAALCCACAGTADRTAEPAAAAAEQAASRPPAAATAPDTLLRSDALPESATVVNPPSFNGTLVLPPQSRATVSLTMDGTVRTLTLEPGARVRRGEVLCTLENPSFIALQQSFLDAQAQTEFLHAEYLRQQTLAHEEAASRKRFQQSRADYRSMKSRMDAAAARLRLLGVDTARLLRDGIRPLLEVRSPIDGFVVRMDMNSGRHFAAGEPLCEIIDRSRVMLRLIAYEKDLAKVAVGDELVFHVNGMGDEPFSGRVTSIGQQVDDAARSIEIYARPARQDARFRSGMYVTAQVCGGRERTTHEKAVR